jgi:hypothetical protein
MTLYELTDALAMLENEQEDLDPEIFRDTFEGLEGAFEDKCDGWAKWIRGMKADVQKLKEEESRMALRRKRIETAITKAEDTMAMYMRTVGKTKFKTALFSYGFRKSQAVEITSEEDLPAWALIEQPPKISKTEIKEHLKAGETVPGAVLVENESLSIK